MRQYSVIQVDAFTTTPLQGNACTVVMDADDLTPTEMQSVAREFNLSETAFVLKSQVADARARYFTPLSEIPLAGHPTIVTIYALVESGRLRVKPPVSTAYLETAGGRHPDRNVFRCNRRHADRDDTA